MFVVIVVVLLNWFLWDGCVGFSTQPLGSEVNHRLLRSLFRQCNCGLLEAFVPVSRFLQNAFVECDHSPSRISSRLQHDHVVVYGSW